MNIKIEKDIPVPKSRYSGKRDGVIAIFKKMAVGDSFLIKRGEWKSLSNVYIYSKMAHIVVMVRETPDGKRVWRIK